MLCWAALLAALSIPACRRSGPVEALRLVRDRDASAERRVAAIRRLGPLASWPDSDLAVPTVAEIVWSDRQPDSIRIAAAQAWADHDADGFRRAARRRLATLESWGTLDALCAMIAERSWSELTPSLVRSYARPARQRADADRPERAAIIRLHPGRTFDDVLVGVLTADEGEPALIEQAAAWQAFVREVGAEAAEAQVAALPPSTALIADLRAAAVVLDVLPADVEGLLWLTAARSRDGGRWWARAEARVRELRKAGGVAGLELRHLPALIARRPHELHREAEDSLARIHAEVSRRQPGATRTEFGGVPGAASESLGDAAAALSLGDSLTIEAVLEATGGSGVRASLFQQADADHADATSEHGGVLLADEKGYEAKPFAPALRAHDRAFYASPELIAALYTGIAHYHFHAQEHDNAAYAGPGGGDLDFADRLRAACVVFTFVDADTLNVDYYQPGRVVVDLGSIRRPGS